MFVTQGLSNSVELVSSMKLYLQSACQLGFLTLCCVLIAVRESNGTFVPGRCMCPETQQGVRGQLKEVMVYPKSPRCDKVTVMVTLMNNVHVCLNPEAPMGKQLIRCWNRAQKLGRNMKVCLRRMRGKGRQRQRFRQRSRSQTRKTSPSNSQ